MKRKRWSERYPVVKRVRVLFQDQRDLSQLPVQW